MKMDVERLLLTRKADLFKNETNHLVWKRTEGTVANTKRLHFGQIELLDLIS